MPVTQPIFLATRGSALALAQANMMLAQCRQAFPQQAFELKIIKTTGDKLQTASLANPDVSLPKGLFTKELEVALLAGEADLAVHSLKDLPTELPEGLMLGAVSQRADVRDVLVYRKTANAASGNGPLSMIPHGGTVATSSTRRKAQLLKLRPDVKVVEIRGNVGTRLKKLAENPELSATILAAAGLERLHFQISADGTISGNDVPAGLVAYPLSPEEMLPCVGQAAIGIEIRENDERIAALCAKLNHAETFHCVTAERAFLRAMGGGCQSPVAAYGQIKGGQLRLRAVSFRDEKYGEAEATRVVAEAALLGQEIATRLK